MTMKNPVVVNVLNNNRFSLRMPYHRETVEVIRTIEKRFWDHKFQTWYLPMKEYTNILDFCRMHKMHVVERKDDAIVWSDGHEFIITLCNRLEKYKEFIAIKGVVHDKQRKLFTCPFAEHDKVIKFFDENSLQYDVRAF